MIDALARLPAIDGFAWPWLLLAWPLPWLVRAILRPVAPGGSALRVPFYARLQGLAQGRAFARAGGGAGVLAWIAWTLLCIAAARPQALGEPLQPPQRGRDLMLALDLSGSMSELDMTLGGRIVDRLTAAKAVLADFLDRRAGDRVGLIVFGRRAYVMAPLTLDRASVREQLMDAAAGLAGQETAIGDAIALAVKRLRDQPPGQRVVILLTDGVNTAGQLAPEKAAQLARDEGVRVHTVAFGGAGTLTVFGIPLPNPGGADIDESTLRAVALGTGGQFFRARDAEELARIYVTLDRIEPVARPGEAVRPRIERYPWPLAASMLVALLALAHGGRRWRR